MQCLQTFKEYILKVQKQLNLNDLLQNESVLFLNLCRSHPWELVQLFKFKIYLRLKSLSNPEDSISNDLLIEQI